ncbi:glutathionylspermidine synthase family protein, partial [Enterobacter hormaechei subsp. oharae]|nr:glutathionylspermidine synthase family protein [Enterobacter hormaechei subsp. oharae]
YGRMDFVWTEESSVKLLEYNADTPTSLYESAYFQWQWMEDARRSGIIPRDADQFNSIQDKLVARFEELATDIPLYFCCCKESEEDRGTLLYLEDCAVQAGLNTRFIYMDDIGLGTGGFLTDIDDNVIRRAFKLYPLEWMMRDENGPLLCARREQWLEPLWKSIISNKGILPLLWRFFTGHPNLLPAWFENELTSIPKGVPIVRKPLFSREGGNVTIFDAQRNIIESEAGDYANEPM